MQGAQKKKKKKDPAVAKVVTRAENPEAKKKPRLFGDEEAMKKKMRAALIKPQYNVTQMYKTSGCFQWIAKSAVFEQATFAVILLNAIWIAVDTDNNDAAVLSDAHMVFQIA